MAEDGIEFLGVAKRGKHRGEKRWLLRVTWVDRLTGKRRDAEKTVSANNKLDALNKRKAFLLERIAENGRSAERKRVRDVRAEWLATISRYATHKQWKSISKLFCAWKPPALKGVEIGDVFIDAVTPQPLQAYMAMMASESYEVTTMDAHRSAIGRMFEYAKSQGYVAVNVAESMTTVKPKLVGPVKEKRKPKALMPEQAEAFMVYIEKNEPELYTMLMSQYVLGSRFAEVSALWLEDVDFTTGLVNICRGQVDGHLGPPKNNKARTAAVGMSGLKLLIEHRDRMLREKWPGHETLLFPRPLFYKNRRKHDYWSYSTVEGMISRAFEALGFDMGAVTHVARHTMNNTARMFGSEAFMRRVREQIGHADERRSQNYSEVKEAEALQIGQSMESVLFGPKEDRTAVVLELKPTNEKPRTSRATDA
jgi:integrase